MKIFIINIILLLSISISASLDIFTSNKIADNVNKQFNLNANKSQITIRSIDTIKDTDNDDIIIYIYNLNPIGFILIPNSDKSEPYLAYSFNSNFRKDNLPDNLFFMIESYKQHIKKIEELSLKFLRTNYLINS